MKRFASVFNAVLALALVPACNDAELAGAPAQPEETPGPDPTPEPTAEPTPPLPEQAEIAVDMHWDDLGLDWELHLVKPGGRINDALTDCTWTTCIYSSPDWGV